MTTKTPNANVIIDNTTNMEGITMKKTKDYTLNGTINATNWQEFRAAMKEAGINTGTKTYDALVEEYNALQKKDTDAGIAITVGDGVANDIYYPELQEEVPATVPISNKLKPEVITKLPVELINKILEGLNSRKRKFDSRGLIYTKDVYSAVCKAYCWYTNSYGKLPESKIKGVINFMVSAGYLTFKKDDANHIQFFLNFNDVIKDGNKVIGVK